MVGGFNKIHNLLIVLYEFNKKPIQIFSDLVSEHPCFVIINYEQVYREMNHFFNQWFITLFLQELIKSNVAVLTAMCRRVAKN